MATKLLMPKLGLTMTEGLIVNILKAEGDTVEKGEGVYEIETEKLTNVIEAPVSGVILKLVGKVGESLPIAATLAYIGEAGEDIPAEDEAEAVHELPPPPVVTLVSETAGTENAAGKSGRVFASPAARALAKKLGIDYTALSGSGPGGRIVKKDVENAAAAKPAPIQKESIASVMPYAGMRKAIGDGMSYSWQSIPMVTHNVRADVTALLALREELNRGIGENDTKIGVLDLFTKIVAKAIKDYPIINSSLTDGKIYIHEDVNIGIATALENGLVVPVVRNVESKSLFEVSREIKSLVSKARSGRATRDDMSGGTFTISNLGSYGSVDFFSPIINSPEAAILGICRTVEEPVVRNGEIVIRSMTGLSFTFDHRIIDGAPAAEFLARILLYLENPIRALFGDER